MSAVRKPRTGTAASTPLAARLRARIAAEGPIPVADYMEACLADPDYGYYRSRDPFGARGDFTTSPEISQIFGELIGLWAAEVWRSMGAPDPVRLIELGPGRGTLLADALRAARAVPGFSDAIEVHLVETSPVLRTIQAETLSGCGRDPVWHATAQAVADGPAIVVANEFLDALPVRQFTRRGDRWVERMVTAAPEGGFVFCDAAAALENDGAIPEGLEKGTRDGDIAEVRPATDAVIAALAERSGPLAALVIDYGHATSGRGDTLQAVSRHGYADPLEAPGTRDLTAHVDFAALADTARAHGLSVHGPIPQGAFLTGLGLAQRAGKLMQSTSAGQAQAIESGARRLADPAQMGALFKAIALTCAELPAPPPFGVPLTGN